MIKPVKITEMDIDFVKNYLRIEDDEDDLMIMTMLEAAKSFIQSYLNQKFEDFEELPNEFSIAALAIIAHWYERREIHSDKDTRSELRYVFAGLLDMHRLWNAEVINEN